MFHCRSFPTLIRSASALLLFVLISFFAPLTVQAQAWSNITGNVYRTTGSGSATAFSTNIAATTSADNPVTPGETFYANRSYFNLPANTPFGISWSGNFTAPTSGVYTFTVTSDDGFRFSLNFGGNTVGSFSHWNTTPTGAVTTTYTMTLTGGYFYAFGLDYFEDGAGGGQISISTVAPSAPTTPLTLTGSAANGSVVLNWNADPLASYYRLGRAVAGATSYSFLAQPSSTAFVDMTGTPGVQYYYIVYAVDGFGNRGPNSNYVLITFPPPVPPVAPTSLTAMAGNANVVLNWVAPAGTVTSYNVKRSLGSGGPYTTVSPVGAITGTTYTDTSAANRQTYYYVVSAVNAVGEGTNSAPAPASPAAPDDAQFVSQSVPTTMTAGRTYAAQVTLKNVGTNTWPVSAAASGYVLVNVKGAATFDPTWGTPGYTSSSLSTPPGNTQAFTVSLTAPPTPGVYPFSSQMNHWGLPYFGDVSPPVSITVAAAPVVTVTTGVWQPNPALVSQAITSPVNAGVTGTPAAPSGHSLSQNWTWTTGRVFQSADGSAGSFGAASNYSIGWIQGSAATQFLGSFINAGYYIVEVKATVTFHDDTAGTDIGTYSGLGYIGSTTFVPPAGSAVLRVPQALPNAGAVTVDGIAVKAKPIDHLAYSLDGITYQSVTVPVTAITGQNLWFQAYKDATTAFPTASVKWRQGHTSGTQQAADLNSGNPINPIKVSFTTASASPSDTSQDVTAIVGTAYLTAHVVVTAPVITLAAPDPAGRPDNGDGTNQFVYDATPSGILNFPGSIKVVGATADVTAWIMRGNPTAQGVTLTVDLPAESVIDGWGYWDHSLLASVPADTIAIKYGSSSLGDGFLYAGLPKNNSGFGNHLVTLNVNTKPIQQAHIQTFFSLDASNWPSSDGKTPNWFHYWSMTSAVYGTPVYEHGTRCHTEYDATTNKWVAYIDDDTVSKQFPAYDNASGIDAFAWECRHEAQHVENATSWWGTTPLPGTSSAYDPSKDKDGDGIPDSLEHDLGMKFHPELGGYNPTLKVTPNLQDHFHYGSDYNDNEDYTQHMQRQNHPWTNGSADKEDWASPGHQKK